LYVGVVACQKEKPKVVLEATPSAVNEMPAFNMTKTDGSTVAFKAVDGKVMIVFFNPGCDHCQREAQMMAENKDVFKDYQVYFVTPEPMDSVAKFRADYHLDNEANFHFGQGDIPQIISAVGPITTVPTIFVYDKQKFVARSDGETSLDKLKEILR
jgi:peroxiredoxin